MHQLLCTESENFGKFVCTRITFCSNFPVCARSCAPRPTFVHGTCAVHITFFPYWLKLGAIYDMDPWSKIGQRGDNVVVRLNIEKNSSFYSYKTSYHIISIVKSMNETQNKSIDHSVNNCNVLRDLIHVLEDNINFLFRSTICS